MSLAAAIKTILRGDLDVAAIVGTKVWPLYAVEFDPTDPDTQPPFLTYEVRRDGTFDSLSSGPADHRPGEIVIGVYGPDYDRCDDLSGAVSYLLSGYGGTVAGIEIDTDFVTESEIEEAVSEGEETAVSVRTQTYKCLYRKIPA